MPKRRYKAINELSKRQRIRIVSNAISETLPSSSSNTNDCHLEIPVAVPLSTEDNDFPPYLSDHCPDSSDSDNEVIPEPIDHCNEILVPVPETKDDEDKTKQIVEQIAFWSSSGITHSKVNDILGILRQHECFSNVLPKDVRTLLKTPRSYDIRPVSPGSYYHFGIGNGILHTIKTHKIESIPNRLKLHVNVDGTPLAKSSGSQFWPILGALNLENRQRTFLIAVYHGYTKPDCSNDFMLDFVEEANRLIEQGITINNRLFQFEITAFSCDAPARSFLKKIKNHNGYYGCDKCTQKGLWLGGKVVFPDKNASLRTDVDFVTKTQAAHHVGESILENITGLKMVSHFPNDYMHSVCLGAMRKLVFTWMRGDIPYRLSANVINLISTKLIEVRLLVPCEFARKPRSLKEIDRWKATEFRLLLLYTGPFVLKPYLRTKTYTHFLSLHTAIRKLTSPSATTQVESANRLLLYFFKHYRRLYGQDQLTFNIHSLIHIANDVRTLGPLDSFSAFKFENYLHTLKLKIKQSALPLQQIIRRTVEERSVTDVSKEPRLKTYPYAEHEHYQEGTLIEGVNNPQYKKLSYQSFVISITGPKNANNCVIMKNGSICVIENIATSCGRIVLVGRKFMDKDNFFVKPIQSKKVNIYEASNLSGLQAWHAEDVKYKALCFPINEKSYYVAALLHHE